jgi:hypothetical protein
LSFTTRARFAGFIAPLALAMMLAGVMASPALAINRQAKNVLIIKKVAAQHGYKAADTKALITLAKRESGLSSTPRTGSYVGLFQVPCEGWVAKKGRWKNPEINTQIALQYIEKRYKTPRRALAHSYSHGWY